jgi:hypothetical protein
MPFASLAAFLQSAPPTGSSTARAIVRVVAGIAALVMVCIILFRRKNAKQEDDED